jgi:hypothetical protein
LVFGAAAKAEPANAIATARVTIDGSLFVKAGLSNCRAAKTIIVCTSYALRTLRLAADQKAAWRGNEKFERRVRTFTLVLIPERLSAKGECKTAARAMNAAATANSRKSRKDMATLLNLNHERRC